MERKIIDVFRRKVFGELERKYSAIFGEIMFDDLEKSCSVIWRNHVRRFGEIVFGDSEKRGRHSYDEYVLEFIMK